MRGASLIIQLSEGNNLIIINRQWRELKMDGTELDPEIKWKTMVGLFLNYVKHIHKILSHELDKKTYDKIINRIAIEFWTEQAHAFIDLFAIKPKNAKSAHRLKTILAGLLDIELTPIKKMDDEVIDEKKMHTCTVRQTLQPVWEGVCEFCESWGQILMNQLGPGFQHKVKFNEDICRHTTTQKKDTTKGS